MSAEGVLATDIQTGEIILAKNKAKQFPIASITKLMTALVSLETIDQSQIAIVSLEPLPEKIRASKLSERKWSPQSDPVSLLLESSNAAAKTLADHIRDKNFVIYERKSRINRVAENFFHKFQRIVFKKLVHAGRPFSLISYILKQKTNTQEITRKKNLRKGWKKWANRWKIFRPGKLLGEKTGYTDSAGQTFAGVFSCLLSQKSRRVAIIILRAATRDDDVIKDF